MLSGILVQDSECAHQHEKPKRRIKSPYKEEKVHCECMRTGMNLNERDKKGRALEWMQERDERDSMIIGPWTGLNKD